MTTSKLRGHPIRFDDGAWRFADNGDSTVNTHNERPCGKCGSDNTPEGHDACLGTLPEVKNACCGHGEAGSAYVQFDDGVHIQSASALYFFEEMQ